MDTCVFLKGKGLNKFAVLYFIYKYKNHINSCLKFNVNTVILIQTEWKLNTSDVFNTDEMSPQ